MHGAFGKFPFFKGLSPYPEKPKTRLDEQEQSPWSKERMRAYALPGETLRAGDVARYVESNENFYAQIDERAKVYVEQMVRTLVTPGTFLNAVDLKYCTDLIALSNEKRRDGLYASLSSAVVERLKTTEEYSISLLYRFPEKYRAEIVKGALRNPHPHVRKYYAFEILYLSEPYRAEAIAIALQDQQETVRKYAQRPPAKRPTIHNWEEETRPSIVHYKPSRVPKQGTSRYKELQERADNVPLYDAHTDPFGRRPFAKGGSDTTLLDTVPGDEHDPLRGRLIIRHIDITAYDAWKRAYEAYDVWKELGFDYVPIEPIASIRFKNSARPTADVFTRVLGVNADDWLSLTTNTYGEHIIEHINKIRDGLEKLKITHGHPHLRNFCLYFAKGTDGKPDLTVPPRVYMIDFDRAQWIPHTPL